MGGELHTSIVDLAASFCGLGREKENPVPPSV
jgi:hypothetical protein